MKLLVDIGNSRLKWACTQDGIFTHKGEAPHPKGRFDAFAKKHWTIIEAPESILVSSVACHALTERLIKWLEGRWSINVETVETPAQGWGVTNAYREPGCLGSDRWAALVAARRRVKGPVCIVDCGSAVTIDVLSCDGTHQGGLIIPGLSMMRTALTENTSGIVMEDPSSAASAVSLLARDTNGAVMGGTLYAMVALIDRITADITAELRTDPVRMITGGDAPTVLPLLAGSYQFQQDLVLEGLAIMAESKG